MIRQWRARPDLRVLLRNRDTGLFLKGKKLWTYYAAEAQDFLSCLNALEFTRWMRITNAEFILSSAAPAWT
jgi:hypothetical protein